MSLSLRDLVKGNYSQRSPYKSKGPGVKLEARLSFFGQDEGFPISVFCCLKKKKNKKTIFRNDNPEINLAGFPRGNPHRRD